MSRCFPYYPQGIEETWNNNTNGGVFNEPTQMQSIVEREQEKAKKESRREKKREKKEKKKEKKEKRRERKEKEKEKEKEKYGDGEVEKNSKRERSSLTEEHEQPASLQKIYDSSDSTQNSGKKRKHSSSEGVNNQCTMLRIRLPLLKHKDVEVPPSKEQALPNSGRMKITTQKMADIAPRTSNVGSCSVLGRTDIITQKMVINNESRSIKEQARPISGTIENFTRKIDNVDPRNSKQPHSIPGRIENRTQKMADTAPRFSKEQAQPVCARNEINSLKIVDIAPSFGREKPCSSAGRTDVNTQKMIFDRVRTEHSHPGNGRTEITAQKIPGTSKKQCHPIAARNEISTQKIDSAPRTFKDPPCPISGRTETITQNMADTAPITNKVQIDSAPRTFKEQLCPISGRTETITQMADIVPRTSKELAVVAARSNKEQPCSTSGRTEVAAQDMAEPAAPRSRSSKTKRLDADSQLRYLIENWVPPPLQIECDNLDDQEWLFESCREPKRLKASDAATCLNYSLWPQATYLPEVDMYALPYTVPY